jgi:hypothetical protein
MTGMGAVTARAAIGFSLPTLLSIALDLMFRDQIH